MSKSIQSLNKEDNLTNLSSSKIESNFGYAFFVALQFTKCAICVHTKEQIRSIHICAAKYMEEICHDEETSSCPTVVSVMNTMIYRQNHLNYEGWEADRVVII